MIELFTYTNYIGYFMVQNNLCTFIYSNMPDLIKDLNSDINILMMQVTENYYNDNTDYKLLGTYVDFNELIEDITTNKIEELL